MAVTNKEKEIMRQLKGEGKSMTEALAVIAGIRNGRRTAPEPKPEPIPESESLGILRERDPSFFSDVSESFTERTDDIAEGINEGQSPLSTGLQFAGNTLGVVGDVATAGVSAAARAVVPQGIQDTFGNAVEAGTQALSESEIVQNLTAKLAEFDESNPELARNLRAGLGLVEGAGSLIGAGVAGTVGKTVGKQAIDTAQTVGTLKDARSGLGQFGQGVAAEVSARTSGVAQVLKDGASTIGRGAKKIDNHLIAKGDQAKKTPTLSLAEQAVVKLDVPEQTIEFIKSVPKKDLETFREMINLAGKKELDKTVLDQPKNIAGKSFIDAFKNVEEQRKSVGAQIGQRTQALSKTNKLDLSKGIDDFENILSELGVKIIKNGEGAATKFGFANTGFTTSQRGAINEMYKLMTEGGKNKTPHQVWLKDSLFSKFQREKLKDNVSDLNFTDGDGNLKNLFGEARDIFSRQLDEIDPEIKGLNKQYRELRGIKDQVTGEILKSESKRVADNLLDVDDFADTAGLSLQRIFSNADGGVRNARIVNLVMQKAINNGFDGANPITTSRFARDLEDLFDIQQSNSFSGRAAQGVDVGSGSLGSRLLDKVNSAGAVDKLDQRKAIENLIAELLKE